MGCAPSTPEDPSPRGKGAKKPKKGGREDSKAASGRNPLKPGGTDNGTTEAPQAPLGRDKYIGDEGALCMGSDSGLLIVFVPSNYSGLAMSYRDTHGRMYAKEWATDGQLEVDKVSQGIEGSWAPFYKSIASDTIKGRMKVSPSSSLVTVTAKITSSKDPKGSGKPFIVKLTPCSNHGADLFRLVMEPMVRMVQRKRSSDKSVEQDKEAKMKILECTGHVAQARLSQLLTQLGERKPIVAALRNDSSRLQRTAFGLETEVAKADRRLRRLTSKEPAAPVASLDSLYEEGGPRAFQHVPAATHHVPKMQPYSNAGAVALTNLLPLMDGETVQSKISKVVSDPRLQQLYKAGDDALVQGVLNTMLKIDEWDYNVFELERHTNGHALFYTTYALLYKLDLINHFGMDDGTLRRFLQALEAGYHPNPYHNATHAADVAQINYYIMVKGGLVEKCKLSREEILAGVLAGAIHDYDHPGFNNSFHTRTNAYLSTLYNDRSILENHHCACVYEMVRHPRYNIFASLSDDQRKEVRETILEMVLSTDMGNHARIFGQFHRRLGDRPDWSEKKDDIRLALSLSIKMADISNCGRPKDLYLEWAKNIAAEFYVQGDAESTMGLNISPFMDRSKGTEDFPKGQVSFMKFIVIPMFESIAEFLPNMEFCLQHCSVNRDHWKRGEEV